MLSEWGGPSPQGHWAHPSPRMMLTYPLWHLTLAWSSLYVFYITVEKFTQHRLGSVKQQHWVICSGFCLSTKSKEDLDSFWWQVVNLQRNKSSVCVKALQGLGMLDVSMRLWMQRFSGSMVRRFRWGCEPKLDRGREGNNELQDIDKDKTKVQLQLLPDTYSWGRTAYNIRTQARWVME